jgi:hypothetical protein
MNTTTDSMDAFWRLLRDSAAKTVQKRVELYTGNEKIFSDKQCSLLVGLLIVVEINKKRSY